MRWFGLSPDQVETRAAQAPSDRGMSLPYSMLYGAASVCAVSLVAYSIYAFELIRGTGPMYATIAAIYVVLTGAALSRLLMSGRSVGGFVLLFAIAFLLYAAAWCAFWFGLRGKFHADLWGAAVGLGLMTFVLQRAFGRRGGFLAAFGVLFAGHTLGFGLGDTLHAIVRGSTGKLLWGAGHGLGFGAGLGYVLFHCQTATQRDRTPSTP